MTTPCFFHPTVEAVGVMLVAGDPLDICTDCAFETLDEDVYPVDLYDGGPLEAVR